MIPSVQYTPVTSVSVWHVLYSYKATYITHNTLLIFLFKEQKVLQNSYTTQHLNVNVSKSLISSSLFLRRKNVTLRSDFESQQ